MKRITVLCVAAALIALSSMAQAQAPVQTIPADVNLTWQNPTTADDQTTPLAGALAITSIQVFADTKAIADVPGGLSPANPTGLTPMVVTGAQTTAVYSATVSADSTFHFRLRACAGSICSDLSAEATKAIVLPKPGVPTNITISIQIRAS